MPPQTKTNAVICRGLISADDVLAHQRLLTGKVSLNLQVGILVVDSASCHYHYMQSVEPRALLSKLSVLFARRTNVAKECLHVDVAPNVPTVLFWDPVRVTQVRDVQFVCGGISFKLCLEL
jgi:hypothetical protein